MLHSVCQQIWKTQQWPQDWKRSVFIPVPKKGNAKECSNYCTIVFTSHASKVMLRILPVRFQQYMNQELPNVHAGLQRGRETRDQIANICWVMEKAREFQKTSTYASLTMLKTWTKWISTNCGKFLEIRVPDHLTCLLRNCMQVKKQQLELDMEKWTGFKLEKEYIKAIYWQSAYF